MMGKFHDTFTCARAFCFIAADERTLAGVITLSAVTERASHVLQEALEAGQADLEKLLHRMAVSVSLQELDPKGHELCGELQITLHTGGLRISKPRIDDNSPS